MLIKYVIKKEWRNIEKTWWNFSELACAKKRKNKQKFLNTFTAAYAGQTPPPLALTNLHNTIDIAIGHICVFLRNSYCVLRQYWIVSHWLVIFHSPIWHLLFVFSLQRGWTHRMYFKQTISCTYTKSKVKYFL